MSLDFSQIRRILLETATNATAIEWQERVTAAVHQLDALQAEVEKLKQENSDAVAHCRELQAQIATYSALNELVEYRGIFFKRAEIKQRSAVPLCPKCRFPMHSKGRNPFHCAGCQISAQFFSGELSGIVRELAERMIQEGND